MKPLFYPSLLLILLTACNGTDETMDIRNPKIREAFENRKTEFINENMTNCKEDILNKAEIYVDSVIAAEIDYRISDSIIFPEKPLRPEWPGDILVPDSIKAKPIFK
jgi:hypothetical protein